MPKGNLAQLSTTILAVDCCQVMTSVFCFCSDFSNRLFFKIFLIMCLYWTFLLVSWLPFNGTYYSFVIVNGIVAPLYLYSSLLSQKRVRFLLKKVCCFENCLFRCCRPDNQTDIPEWGEEMLAMYR